jgi:Cytochrome c7 and related cytochrome c
LTVIFPKWTNRLPLLLGLGAVVLGLSVVFVVWFWFSPRHTDVGYQPIQPVPYSHKLHAGMLGMDCRYCHRMVETGPHATVPDTETCMGCHAQVKNDSPLLQPVRDAFASGNPVPWVKVHMLPDFAYFNHAVHVHAGVGCATCHGRIDQMETVHQVEPLSMGWCLECHRDPAKNLRPLDKITDMAFQPDPAEGAKFLVERNLHPPTHCSGCHR